MFKNYLKVTFRNIKRHKVYSFINITGLALGMACCVLIFLYVRDELSYDRHHENADRIYRLIDNSYQNGKWVSWACTNDQWAPALKHVLPEVVDFVRFYHPWWVEKWPVSYQDKCFYEKELYFADPSVFDVFGFRLVKGDPGTALEKPDSVVITEETARKYFGGEDPMGKILSVDGRIDLEVTGVARSVPRNSHFRFDLLAAFEAMPDKWALHGKSSNFYSYVLLRGKLSREDLKQKLEPLYKRYHDSGEVQQKLYLQPLRDIHLHSRDYFYEMAANNGDISYVYIFSAIAVFVLLIACFNFMNLTTARSANRAKEVGMRKVMGAKRSQLVKQFLGESLFFSLTSLLFALILVRLFLPIINILTDKKLALFADNSLLVIATLLGIALFVGMIAGSYPALILSRFQPFKVLRGSFSGGAKKVHFRKVLVVAQFVISIILIIGSIVISRQMAYCRDRNLGFDKDNVVCIPLLASKARGSYESFRSDLLEIPRVKGICTSDQVPGKGTGERGMVPEGNQPRPMHSLFVDYDFLETFGIEVKEGRGFSPEFPSDRDDGYMVNEAAVSYFGWDSAVGKKLFWLGDANKTGYVVGVVKDFNFQSLHQKIEPLVLQVNPGRPSYISVRIAPQNVINTMAFIQKQWEKSNPNHSFEYFFLDDHFDRLYRSEKRMGEISRYFTFLALFISCLGLFGLASFTAEQMTKEIGIRKVLGATTMNIVHLFSRGFTRWVVLANIVAWPVAYYVMNRWLQNFAYRTSIGPWPFIQASILAFLVALFAVSFQAVRAAMANPVESLRHE